MDLKSVALELLATPGVCGYTEHTRRDRIVFISGLSIESIEKLYSGFRIVRAATEELNRRIDANREALLEEE